jgi:hypothetical protein
MKLRKRPSVMKEEVNDSERFGAAEKIFFTRFGQVSDINL